MKLSYRRVNDLSQLHDELLTNVPTLAGRIRVEGRDDAIALTVPDDADVGAINAVIAAHSPATAATPPPRPSGATLTTLRTVAQSSGTLTTAQLSDGLRAMIALIRHRSGDL